MRCAKIGNPTSIDLGLYPILTCMLKSNVRQYSCVGIMLKDYAAQLSNHKSKCMTPNLQLLFVYTAVTVTGESQQLQSDDLHLSK